MYLRVSVHFYDFFLGRNEITLIFEEMRKKCRHANILFHTYLSKYSAFLFDQKFSKQNTTKKFSHCSSGPVSYL